MMRVIAFILGEGRCPNCESSLTSHEAGYHICTNCAVVVDYSKGGWRFAGEPTLRQLPGMSGLAFTRKPAADPVAEDTSRPARPRLLLPEKTGQAA